MAMVINSNIQSLNAQRHLNSSLSAQNSATERLSSGLRINSASDDAAGLAIANRMTSQVKGLDMAIRNANDGVSMIQTAEGALSQTTNILQRMRELSIQSANGIYDTGNRGTLNAEVQQLKEEIDRIAETTTFNGLNILDGSLGKVGLQIGEKANQTIDLDIQAMDTKTLGMGSTSTDVKGSANSIAGTTTLSHGDVLINGQSIMALGETWDNAGTTQGFNTLEDLTSLISKNISGVSASTFATNTAEKAGDGILSGASSVQIDYTNNDGTTSNFTVKDTSSLQELADKINQQGGGLVSAAINEGKISISAEGVSDLKVTDSTSAAAAGTFASATGMNGAAAFVTVNSSLALKSDNGEAINIERGTTGTLNDLQQLGFREGNKAGVVEGNKVGGAAFSVGDLSINGVAVGVSATGGVSDKVKVINEVSSDSGVTASAFTTAALDFDGFSGYVGTGATFVLNGHDVTVADGSGTAQTIDDFATAINAETDKTGVTATKLGQKLILEGDVAGISISQSSTAVTVSTATVSGTDLAGIFGHGASTTGQGTVNFIAGDVEAATAGAAGVDVAASLGIGAATPAARVADGGIKLTSENGSPISVTNKDAAAQVKSGLLDANSAADGKFGAAVNSLDISTAAGANKAIDILDTAIQTISDVRGELGAVTNRLDFTVQNLANVSENASAAKSRIMDADFAAESANLSRAQVLQSAGNAMLAQANSRPQQVLSLLQ
jgi:flagellin